MAKTEKRMSENKDSCARTRNVFPRGKREYRPPQNIETSTPERKDGGELDTIIDTDDTTVMIQIYRILYSGRSPKFSF